MSARVLLAAAAALALFVACDAVTSTSGRAIQSTLAPFVYTMGYMDEEVAHTLRGALAAKAKFKRIFVVERHIANSAFLFERPLTTYANTAEFAVSIWDKGNSAWTSGTPGTLADDAAAADVKKAAEAYNKAVGTWFSQNVAPHNFADTKFYKRKNQANPVSVVQFQACTASCDALPVLIIMRTMEMGMNPVVFHKVNLEIMKYFKENVHKNAYFDFFAIGASGALNSGDYPGCVHQLKASIYAGWEQTDATHYKVAVEFASENDLAPKPVKGDGVVQENPATVTVDNTRQDTDMRKHVYDDYIAQKYRKDVKDKIEKASATGDINDKKNIGYTTGWFQGLEEKQEGDAVGAHASNTEDYHMIRLIQQFVAEEKVYGKLYSDAVLRVDADPFQVGQTNTNLVNAYLADPTRSCVSSTAYDAVTNWVQAGMRTEAVPDELCWNLQGLTDSDFFRGTKSSDQQRCILNPFLVESASDMLKDGVEQLGKLKPAVVLSSPTRTAIAVQLNTTWKVCPAGKLPIWIRDGWPFAYADPDWTTGAIPTGTVMMPDGVAKIKLKELGVDRVFYKSSNQAALKYMNDKLFAGTVPIITAVQSLDTTFPCPATSARFHGARSVKARIQRILQA